MNKYCLGTKNKKHIWRLRVHFPSMIIHVWQTPSRPPTWPGNYSGSAHLREIFPFKKRIEPGFWESPDVIAAIQMGTGPGTVNFASVITFMLMCLIELLCPRIGSKCRLAAGSFHQPRPLSHGINWSEKLFKIYIFFLFTLWLFQHCFNFHLFL